MAVNGWDWVGPPKNDGTKPISELAGGSSHMKVKARLDDVPTA